MLGLGVGILSARGGFEVVVPSVATPNTAKFPHSMLQLRGQALTRADTVFKETPIDRKAKQSTSRKLSHLAFGIIVLM